MSTRRRGRTPNRVIGAHRLVTEAEEWDRLARSLELAGDVQGANQAAQRAENARRAADLLDPHPKAQV